MVCVQRKKATRSSIGHSRRLDFRRYSNGASRTKCRAGSFRELQSAGHSILAPSLIIADEPVSKLDVSVRAKILNLFKAIRTATGVTLVFITHDLRVARYLSHRIAVMYFGKIVELAPASDIFLRPRHPYTQALLGTLAMKARATGADPVEISHVHMGGCRYFNRCPIRTEQCRRDEPSLVAVATDHAVACHEWQHAGETSAADALRPSKRAGADFQ